MKLRCKGEEVEYDFVQVALDFDGKPYRDVFGQKNNKTLAETLSHGRYAKLKTEVMQEYPDALNEPLGKFLLELKSKGDEFYKRFLNRYGDLTYSTFVIADPAYFNKRGVYAYLSDGELKYIGRCRDSMKKRVNQGYGKIYPKNCYLDGQATNCHLNARITNDLGKVTLWLCPMDSDPEIERAESELIQRCSPPWNIQSG
jgi:hypothetical protein